MSITTLTDYEALILEDDGRYDERTSWYVVEILRWNPKERAGKEWVRQCRVERNRLSDCYMQPLELRFRKRITEWDEERDGIPF